MENLEIPALIPLTEEGEQDCACGRESASASLFPSKESNQFSLLMPLNQSSGLYRKDLGHGWALFHNPSKFSPPSILNSSACTLVDAFQSPISPERAIQMTGLPLEASASFLKEAVQAGLLVPADGSSELEEPPNPHALTLWLALTFNCNLSCRYCYVPSMPLSMTEGEGKRAVDWAIAKLKEQGLKALKIKYAGGEPLLCFDLLKAIHEYAQRKAWEENLELREVVLTNGTLLEHETLAFLREEGIAVMLSIDGLGSEQGLLRPLAGGGDSLPLVLRAIELAQSEGSKLFLSATVTSLNLEGLPKLADLAMDLGGPLSLNFYRPNGVGVALLPNPGQLIKVFREIGELVKERLGQGKGPAPNLDLIHPASPSPYPCQGGISFFAFGPGGAFAPCPMLLGKSSASFKPSPVDEDPHCWACFWRYLCGGGCPLLRNHHYCQAYRELIPLWLELKAQAQRVMITLARRLPRALHAFA
jgi:uncharacterized protein